METSTSESYASHLHLPPRDAWKNPDRWLQPLRTDEKLNLPLDDRGFVKTDDAVDMVLDLLKPTFKFEYDPDNCETRDDVHHFYGTERMYEMAVEELIAAQDPNASIPMEFRNLATNLGLMPRQLHNTFHLKTNLVPMPEFEYMDEYVRNYKLGKQILNKMVIAANKTIKVHERRMKRRRTVQQKPEIIGYAEVDKYGEEILKDTYKHQFGNMVNAINEMNASGGKDVIIPNGRIRLERPNPHQILRVGEAASRRAINYAAQIRAS